MFLSKVTLNPRHRATYRLLADVYAQHRFVMSAFPDLRGAEESDEGAQRSQNVLYRLDAVKQAGFAQGEALFFLAQSALEPDWEKAEALHPNVICSHNMKEDKRAYAAGEQYRFRLRASPTVCHVNRDADGTRQKSKREGLFTEDAQREWLTRMAQNSGFNIDPGAVLITPQGKRGGAQPSPEGTGRGNAVTCFTVDYDGLLVVTEEDSFARALREGVGRGKAWGCGLLSLMRA